MWELWRGARGKRGSERANKKRNGMGWDAPLRLTAAAAAEAAVAQARDRRLHERKTDGGANSGRTDGRTDGVHARMKTAATATARRRFKRDGGNRAGDGSGERTEIGKRGGLRSIIAGDISKCGSAAALEDDKEEVRL